VSVDLSMTADHRPPSTTRAASSRIQEHGFSLADLYHLDTEVKEDITSPQKQSAVVRQPSHSSSRRSNYEMDFDGNAESSSSRVSPRRPRTRASRTDYFEIVDDGTFLSQSQSQKV
jgi:hypothetical protein